MKTGGALIKGFIVFEVIFWIGAFVVGINMYHGKTQFYILVFNQVALGLQFAAMLYFSRNGVYLSNPSMKIRGIFMGICSAGLLFAYIISSSIV